MRLKCKNMEAKNKLIKAIEELNYQNYITWNNEMSFNINKFRFKEVKNRIEVDEKIKEGQQIKVCSRCEGKGILKEFITALNPGICFKCRGYGYLPID